MLNLFSDVFKVKNGKSYSNVTIGQIENQLSKVSAPKDESSGFKEIVIRIEELFKATKSKK